MSDARIYTRWSDAIRLSLSSSEEDVTVRTLATLVCSVGADIVVRDGVEDDPLVETVVDFIFAILAIPVAVMVAASIAPRI